MCGIVGAVNIKFGESALVSLRHRGPSGQGIEHISVRDTFVTLGHTRLSILDLSVAGHQPMQSRDGRWWVTFNGEIYNHLDLRPSLPGPFRGHSDTETLVELIAQQGVDKTLPALNGMFAFAALDTLHGKLYLARDPFGVKPVYFAKNREEFAFASEVRTLHQLGIPSAINDQGLRQFLTLRYTPSDVTLWEGVHRLQPGHVLCLDLASAVFNIRCYIEPTADHFHGSFDDAIEAYREALSAAIRRQLLSDVPVGILLSGGVDSALVAAMAKDAGRDLPCFAVGFGEGHAECEIDDAAETARVLGLPFYQVLTTPGQLKDSLPAIVRAVEEPLGTTSIMPMWHLVQRARQDVTVVLTGQGSDEPWGGYFRYQVELVRRLLPLPLLWRFGQKIGDL